MAAPVRLELLINRIGVPLECPGVGATCVHTPPTAFCRSRGKCSVVSINPACIRDGKRYSGRVGRVLGVFHNQVMEAYRNSVNCCTAGAERKDVCWCTCLIQLDSQ